MHLIDRLSNFMAWVSGLLFLLLAFYMTIDAVSRTLGGPFTGISDQVAALTLALGASWSLAYGVKAGIHIRSDVLLPLLGPRLKHGFGVLALMGLSLFAWLLTWRTWALTLESWELGAMLPQSIIDLKLWLAQAMTALGYLVFAISATLAALHVLLRREALADAGNPL